MTTVLLKAGLFDIVQAYYTGVADPKRADPSGSGTLNEMLGKLIAGATGCDVESGERG